MICICARVQPIRDGTGSELLTRDPTRPGRFCLGHWVSVLWIERLFWRRCDTAKISLVYAAHIQSTDHDVKIQNTQNPTDSKVAYSLPKAAIKRAQKLRKPGRTPGLEHWPVIRPDPTKIV